MNGVYKFSGLLNNGAFVEIVVDGNADKVVVFEDYVPNETHYPPAETDLWKCAYKIIEKYNQSAGWKDEGSAALACDGFYWEEITEYDLVLMSRIGDMIETELRRELRKLNGSKT